MSLLWNRRADKGVIGNSGRNKGQSALGDDEPVSLPLEGRVTLRLVARRASQQSLHNSALPSPWHSPSTAAARSRFAKAKRGIGSFCFVGWPRIAYPVFASCRTPASKPISSRPLPPSQTLASCHCHSGCCGRQAYQRLRR